MSNIFQKKTAGFTFIETLLVLGVAIILITLTVVYFGGRKAVTDLQLTGQEVSAAINSVQSNSKTGLDGETWGIRFISDLDGRDKYEIFAGTEYSPENVKETRFLGRGINFSSPSGGYADIIFDSAGRPNETLKIALSGRAEEDFEITINSIGQIISSFRRPSILTPGVTTGNATAISTSTATLNATLTSLGTATEVDVWFEWRTGGGGWNETAKQEREEVGTFSVGLTDLIEGETYEFRAIAESDKGKVSGSEKTFSTITNPVVSTVEARSIETTSANLVGNLTDTGNDTPVNVWFAYKKTTESDWTTTASTERFSTGEFTHSVSGLEEGTSYQFIAYAQNTVGEVSGETKSFNTQIEVSSATEVTCIVDTNTTNTDAHYHSLADAIVGEVGASPKCVTSADLVANDERLTIELRASTGLADTSPVTVEGFTTSEDSYLKIHTHPDHRHSGVWNDTKYRLAINDSNAITIRDQNVHIDGLQVWITNTTNTGRNAIRSDSVDVIMDIKISNNILRGYEDNTYMYHSGISRVGSAGVGSVFKVWNNVIYDFRGSDHWMPHNAGINLTNGANVILYAYNNTIYGTRMGLQLRATEDEMVAINNLIASTPTPFSGTFANGTTHNATDRNSSPSGGTNTYMNQDFSFYDVNNGDFRLTSLDIGATDKGTDLSGDPNLAFSTDIAGTSRPQGSAWNIGAFEGAVEVSVPPTKTEVTCIVDTNTNNTDAHYHSLADAIIGEAGANPQCVTSYDLVRNNEQLTIELRASTGLADTTPVTVFGFFTSKDNYIKITTHPDHRHSGVWDDAKYRLIVDDSDAIDIREKNVHIDGLQAWMTNPAGGAHRFAISSYISVDAVIDLKVSNNILRGEQANRSYYGGIIRKYTAGVGSVIKAWNNVIYDFRGGSANVGILQNSSNIALYAYNNTIYNTGIGLSRGGGTFVAINNLIASTPTPFSGAFAAGTTHNATDQDSSPSGGANTRTNQEFSFYDADNNDFRLMSVDTGAKDWGTDLSDDPNLAFSTDIAGTSRPQGSAWDIGAFESVVEEEEPEKYTFAISASPAEGGTVEDLTDDAPYEHETEVSIKATANPGYQFVNWTAPAGTFASSTATSTTFTMPAQAVTVTANFQEESGESTITHQGKEYKVVRIGSQDWFAENLDYDNGCTGITWTSNTDNGWCGYHTDDTEEANGLLYQWSGAMGGSTTEGAQGLCPDGWHIPTDNDWKQLEMHLGMTQSDADVTGWRNSGEVGAKLKEAGTADPGWSTETCGTVGCNSSFFTARGGGWRGSSFSGGFFDWRVYGSWWSSSIRGGDAWRRFLYHTEVGVNRSTLDRAYSISVRCVRDL